MFNSHQDKERERKRERTPYISAARLKRKGSSFVRELAYGACTFGTQHSLSVDRPLHSFRLTPGATTAFVQDSNLTRAKRDADAAANKKETRNSNKMPGGCKREMVSSDVRLKEIRSQRRGKGIVG